jgi:hypothetical protein
MNYDCNGHIPEDVLTEAALGTASPEVLAHCSECPACGRLLKEMRALKAHLVSDDEEEIPAHVKQQILRHTQTPLPGFDQEPAAVLKWYRNPLVWIAGIIGFAVFTYIFIVFVL